MRNDERLCGGTRAGFAALRGEFLLAGVILLLVAVLGAKTDGFLSWSNLFDLLNSYAFVGIMAAGLLTVLISGGIDISFTATATVAQYVVASILVRHGESMGAPFGWIAIFGAAAFTGLLLGAVNGLLVHTLRVSAMIVTIATLNVFYGILIFVTRGKWLYDFPKWFADGVNVWSFTQGGATYSLSLAICALIAVLVFTAFLLNRTTLGRKIYAMGGNPEAATRMGFNLLGLRLFVFCYMGFLAAIGAVVQAQVMQTVAPNSIVGRELEVLAAVVLGGASLAGGGGTLLGTMLGVALIAILQNGLTLLGVSSYWHQIVIGCVILLSVSATAWNARNGAGKGVGVDVPD